MVKEPTPHLTKSGRWLLGTVGIVVGVLAMTMLVISCARVSRMQARAERPWTQGYETPQGYMQPDHGFLYYWMMTSLLREPQPTYHVYVPPPSYPREYRPWLHYDRETRAVYTPTQWRAVEEARRPRPAPAPVSDRTTGGFSAPPSRSTPSAAPSSRTSGGFSREPSRPAARPDRTTGGFSQPAPSSRTSGGFSSRPPDKPSAPPSRTSGGFSKPSRPPADRTTGGFSKPKKP